VKDAKVTDLAHHVVAARTSAPTPAAEAILPGIPASVRAARRLVSVTLPGCPRLDDLVLAVSELASNAVIWSASGEGGTFTVRVRIAPGWARCEVTDDGPAVLPSGQGTGLGLILVSEVTDRSGAIIGPGASRTAWAEVSWPGAAGRTEVQAGDVRRGTDRTGIAAGRVQADPGPGDEAPAFTRGQLAEAWGTE
jgi:serine/threonine-protein kinase RsbW